MFGTFTTTTTDNDTHEERVGFNKKSKDKFMQHVVDVANEENFKNFKPLIEHIIKTAGIDAQYDATRAGSSDGTDGDRREDHLHAGEVC